MHRELLPDCPIRPVHGDTAQLMEEIASGEIDAAIVTLPVADYSLRVDEIQRDRLMVWLRADHPLAAKAALQPADLQQHPTVLYHPQRNAQALARLLELLEEVGVKIE
jgi:DNA-binding transcriptional LysR family regulator